jgi:predicted CoA-binding protein
MTQINENIPQILKESKTIAVVGISNKTHRPSYDVTNYLLRAGYTIIPVNPMIDEVFGLKCYSSLSDIDTQIDIVDIFRKPSDVEPIVEDAIKINAKTVWMQLGVINENAAQKALEAGLNVVMNHCLKVEHAINRF